MLKSIFVSDDSLKLFLLEFSIIFLEIIGLLILIVRQICKLVVLFISVPVHTKDSSMKKILASVDFDSKTFLCPVYWMPAISFDS